MFKLNMDSLRKTANSAVRLAANAANAANLGGESTVEPEKLAGLAGLAGLAELAVSKQLNCTSRANPANDPAAEPPTDMIDWRELARAYQQHHFACRYCIAAGRGAVYGRRCGVGAALRNAYQESA